MLMPSQSETTRAIEEPAVDQPSNEMDIGAAAPSISSGRPPLQPAPRNIPESASSQAFVLQSSAAASKAGAARVAPLSSSSDLLPDTTAEARTKGATTSAENTSPSIVYAHLSSADPNSSSMDPTGGQGTAAAVSSATCATEEESTAMVEHLKGIEGLLTAMRLQQQAASSRTSMPPPPTTTTSTATPLDDTIRAPGKSPTTRKPAQVEKSAVAPADSNAGFLYATTTPDKSNTEDDETKLVAIVAARAKHRALAAAFPSTMKLLEKKAIQQQLAGVVEGAARNLAPLSAEGGVRVNRAADVPSSCTDTAHASASIHASAGSNTTKVPPPHECPQKAKTGSLGGSPDAQVQKAAAAKLEQWRARYFRCPHVHGK